MYRSEISKVRHEFVTLLSGYRRRKRAGENNLSLEERYSISPEFICEPCNCLCRISENGRANALVYEFAVLIEFHLYARKIDFINLGFLFAQNISSG